MALSIKTERADRLARQLTALTGETITEAVEASLAERLERVERERSETALDKRVAEALAWVDQWRKGLIAKGFDLDRPFTKEEEIWAGGDRYDLELWEKEKAARTNDAP